MTKTSYLKIMNKINFTKIRDVKSPNRANKNDAGIDFYIPNFDNRMIQDLLAKNPHPAEKSQWEWALVVDETNGTKLIINPRGHILIPSGIRVWIESKDSALIAANKSGVATKTGLLFTAQVVDADYTGEIHIGLFNSGNDPVFLSPGDKIIQFVHTPILKDPLEELTPEQYLDLLQNVTTDRGDNGFGSTDKK